MQSPDSLRILRLSDELGIKKQDFSQTRTCAPPAHPPLLPDIPNLGSVLQEPAVGHFVFPPNISGVLPQQPDLITGIPCVPERVTEVLTRACLGFHSLQKHNFPMLTTKEMSLSGTPKFFGVGIRSGESPSLLFTSP